MTQKLSTKAKLQKIEELLFPKLEVRTLTEEQDSAKVLVDSGVIANLLSCLHDLRDSRNDEVVWKSIEAVLDRLQAVKEIIEPDTIPDDDISDINYMIVDFR